jgi:hypothetical protein
VFINALLERVLGNPAWEKRLTAEDRRALSALFWSRVNPYGQFRLDDQTPRPGHGQLIGRQGGPGAVNGRAIRRKSGPFIQVTVCVRCSG